MDDEKIQEIINQICGSGKMFNTDFPQRAKNHDQRKGQWLVNKIRSDPQYEEAFSRAYKSDNHSAWKQLVEQILFNIENDEYDKYMGDYND